MDGELQRLVGREGKGIRVTKEVSKEAKHVRRSPPAVRGPMSLTRPIWTVLPPYSDRNPTSHMHSARGWTPP